MSYRKRTSPIEEGWLHQRNPPESLSDHLNEYSTARQLRPDQSDIILDIPGGGRYLHELQ
jgi:hypothetical protein